MTGWGPKISTGGGGGGNNGNPDIPDSVFLVYQDEGGVAQNTLSTVLSYTTSPSIPTKLIRCSFGGTNVSKFWLYIDGVLQDKYATRFENLNGVWELGSEFNGLSVGLGSLIEVKAQHNRPYACEYWARLSLISVDS